MIRGFFVFLFMAQGAFFNVAFAQLKCLNPKINLGLVEGDIKRYADFSFVNRDNSPINILRVDHNRDRELKFLISKSYVLPGDSAFVRVQLNPISEGVKSKKLLVYHSASNKPISIQLSAKVKNWKALSRQACPDFNDRRSTQERSSFQVKLLVKNGISNNDIPGARIVINNSKDQYSNRNGELLLKLNPGLYNISVEKEGYKQAFIETVFNRSAFQKEILLYPMVSKVYKNNLEESSKITEDQALSTLDSVKNNYGDKAIDTYSGEEEVEKSSETNRNNYGSKSIADLNWMQEDDQDSKKESSQKKDTYGSKTIEDLSWLHEEPDNSGSTSMNGENRQVVNQDTVNALKGRALLNEDKVEANSEEQKKIKEEENPDFSEEEYASNCIVFVIDRSISMGKDKKLETAKSAVLKLIKEFRSVDKLGLITYSTNAEELLPVMNGQAVKNEIHKVEAISSFGKTNGAKGLKEAYKMAYENYIESGNNEVILVSDGAFTDDINDIKRIAKRGAARGIKLSVFGIKNSSWTTSNFEEIAGYSKGSYLHFESEKDAGSQVFEWIKKNSKK